MPINPSTLPEVIQRVRGDLQRYLPNTDIKDNTLLDILAKTWAGTTYEMGILASQVQTELFPNTATGINLETWASTRSISRKGGTEATGIIIATGDVGSVGTVISAGTEFASSAGDIYTSISDVLFNETPRTVTLSLTDNIVTATNTLLTNPYAVNQTVTMSGADQPEYNGDQTVIEAGNNYFKYQVAGSPAPPTTSTSFAAVAYIANPTVQADKVGNELNLESGSELNFVTVPNVNVDATAYVNINGVQGGKDLESDDSLRARLIDDLRGSKRVSFTESDVTAIVKENPSATRVNILRATPNPGQLTVYVASDNNATSIPVSQTLIDVKQRLVDNAPVSIADLDVTTPDAGDIKVLPVSVVVVDFNFITVEPSTDTMKQAIIDNIKSFFLNNTIIGDAVSYQTLLANIENTVDFTSGNALESFNLSTPTATLPGVVGQVYNVGDVTFAN